MNQFILGVERDLAALEDKVTTIGKEADRLCGIHADHADQIQSKRGEIEAYWERLTAKAKERREKLDESYFLHRFLADFRDLVSWINDMKAIISADELAKDVAGAEALLERHQEHRGEIDAREDSFVATTEAGKQLLDRAHYATDEVKEKLSMLSADKNSLLGKRVTRLKLYAKCIKNGIFLLQLYGKNVAFYTNNAWIYNYFTEIPNKQIHGWPNKKHFSQTRILAIR